MKKTVAILSALCFFVICLMPGCSEEKTEHDMIVMAANINYLCSKYYADVCYGEILSDRYDNIIERMDGAKNATIKEVLEYFDIGDEVEYLSDMSADSQGTIFYPSDSRYIPDEKKTELLHKEDGSCTLGELFEGR